MILYLGLLLLRNPVPFAQARFDSPRSRSLNRDSYRLAREWQLDSYTVRVSWTSFVPRVGRGGFWDCLDFRIDATWIGIETKTASGRLRMNEEPGESNEPRF